MHFYPFNIGDYTTATAHLDPLEDIAYRRLMDLYYSTEKPIPKDIEKTARLIRMRSHCDSIAIVLDEFFHLESDGYHCDRIDIELFKFHEKSEKASRSAKARWKKSKENQGDKKKCGRNANALKTHSGGNAKQEPRTNKQEPINKYNPMVRFEEFWDLYSKKTSRAKCEVKFKKLSEKEIDKIFESLPKYVKSTPDKKYRKDPCTWLNGKCWNDEVDSPDDYSFVADMFNDAFKSYHRVPEAGMMTQRMIDSYNFLINNTPLTKETTINYFNAASCCRVFQWAREDERYEARGIEFYLEHDSYEKIRREI